MQQFLILILIVAIVMIAKSYWKFRLEQALRDNPAERRLIEISLPRGEANSAERMARAWRKISAAALGDSKARRKGLRQIDAVYIFEVPIGKTEAVGRFLLYCDPDKMDALKRAVKQTYGQVATVQEIKPEDDPMRELAAALRPPKPAEPAEEGQLVNMEKTTKVEMNKEGVAVANIFEAAGVQRQALPPVEDKMSKSASDFFDDYEDEAAEADSLEEVEEMIVDPEEILAEPEAVEVIEDDWEMVEDNDEPLGTQDFDMTDIDELEDFTFYEEDDNV